MGVETTPEMLHITPQTIDNIQHNIHVMIQSLSYTFRETINCKCLKTNYSGKYFNLRRMKEVGNLGYHIMSHVVT
jgi:hypothetical protein